MSRAAVFALKRASQATRNVMDEQLAAYGLTSAQLDILLYLEMRGDSAQRDLQAALGITSATLTRILDGMVARGFVERRTSETDARAKLITITATADELLCRLEEEEERIFLARFAAGFDEQELQTLTTWLQRLAANMGDTSEAIFGYGAPLADKECE
ncbi:MAG TPA: MarR family winged helix-turn-helix transcriptional regulator [Thermomicrobiales bacterium]|jgi:DNA-binding MarR family transcriptional regulator